MKAIWEFPFIHQLVRSSSPFQKAAHMCLHGKNNKISRLSNKRIKVRNVLLRLGIYTEKEHSKRYVFATRSKPVLTWRHKLPQLLINLQPTLWMRGKMTHSNTHMCTRVSNFLQCYCKSERLHHDENMIPKRIGSPIFCRISNEITCCRVMIANIFF